MFDMSNLSSFNSLKRWLLDFRRVERNDRIPIVLVGNKSDTVDADVRNVMTEKALEFVQRNLKEGGSMQYAEISTKNNENIWSPLKLLATALGSSVEKSQRRANIFARTSCC